MESKENKPKILSCMIKGIYVEAFCTNSKLFDQ